jgi:integrase
MRTRNSLTTDVQEYLSDRRHFGFSLTREGTQLLAFARFAEAHGYDGHLTEELAKAWAQYGTPRRLTSARRLDAVRRFSKYQRQFEPRTEVPQTGLFGPSIRRLTPHIYEAQEIDALLAAAARLPCPKGLRGATYATLFGLLAATGLRLSEALSLRRAGVDLTQGILTLVQSKFRRSRLVPLHISTTNMLAYYASLRDRAIPAPLQAETFFVSARGISLNSRTVEYTFAKLRKQLGWQARGHHPAPRLHDMRHTFICNRLIAWYREGVDLDRAILSLSTYVGHTQVTDTYWYITGIPELMAIATQRFERFWEGSER